MNSIELSLAPHPFDEQKITVKDNSGRPVRIDYYWRGFIVFHIDMTWDDNGWRETMKITNDKPSPR